MNHAVSAAAGLLSLVAVSELFDNPCTKFGCKNVSRTRRSVETLFKELGPKELRRSYPMKQESFVKLPRILCNTDDMGNKAKHPVPNGKISSSARLSMALRWMVGGCKHDIAPNHWVSKNEVMKSVWEIFDLVNFSEDHHLRMKFPTTHEKQKEIAAGFAKKALKKSVFTTCAGCIDCMLVWTEKPSDKDKEYTQIGTGKIFCRRKKKIGLVLQGICDEKLLFTDMEVCQPSSTSDYLTFCTSNII